MTASQLKSILMDNWYTAIIALPLIMEDVDLPLDFINSGIGISEELADYHPAGLMHEETDALGGDIFRLHFIHSSEANCELMFSVIIKIADHFKGDANYDRIYPQSNQFVKLKAWNDRPIPQYLRIAAMPILCNKNNKKLYT